MKRQIEHDKDGNVVAVHELPSDLVIITDNELTDVDDTTYLTAREKPDLYTFDRGSGSIKLKHKNNKESDGPSNRPNNL